MQLILVVIVGLSILGDCHAKFTKATKDLILASHNRWRSEIAKGVFTTKSGKKIPAASDMRKLVWDDATADLAQKWADTIPKGHTTFEQRKGGGENMYSCWSGLNKLDLHQQANASVDRWITEFKRVELPSNKMTGELFKAGAGHATQVAWAKTTKLGCGGIEYNKGLNVLIVCQYQPPGNFFNQNIYESGPACSKCPAGTKCEKSSGLCA